MAVLLLQRPIGFPAQSVRKMLTEFFPKIAWRAGDEDGEAGSVTFLRPHTVMGRAGDGMVMTCITLHEQRYAPANGHSPPPHAAHLTISRPTNDDESIARAIALVVATTIAVEEDGGALLQLEPGENWLDTTDMRSLAKMLSNDDRHLARRHHYGQPEAFQGGPPPARAAAPIPAGPTPLGKADGAKPDKLGSFTILHDGTLHVDWTRIDEAMNVIDPEGNWRTVAIPQGMGFVSGRTKVTLIASPMPYAMGELGGFFSRSFWFDGDQRRVALHRGYMSIMIDAPEAFEARAQTAKAITILIGLVAQHPSVCAVLNNMVSTIFSPEHTHKLVSILHTDEVPIQLWTWTAPNSLTDGDVSLTTGGLAPFLGYEVEVWNAPHTVDFAGEKMNGVLRYLLIKGPVVAHGDTIGMDAEDQSVRCFFGPSRADRVEPVKAMFLEFDIAPPGAPRKDLPLPPTLRPDAPAPQAPATPPPPPSAPAQPAVGAPRRAVFGRKGL
jgi:hypothetical protein